MVIRICDRLWVTDKIRKLDPSLVVNFELLVIAKPSQGVHPKLPAYLPDFIRKL